MFRGPSRETRLERKSARTDEQQLLQLESWAQVIRRSAERLGTVPKCPKRGFGADEAGDDGAAIHIGDDRVDILDRDRCDVRKELIDREHLAA